MNHEPSTNTPASATVRVDVWLWAARFFKTRALSKQAIETGKVEVDGERPKASRLIRAGVQLKIQRGIEVFEVVVLGVSDTRGPAKIAQTLYSESEDSIATRQAARHAEAAARAGYKPPESKPDKRARRLIRALGDIDAL